MSIRDEMLVLEHPLAPKRKPLWFCLCRAVMHTWWRLLWTAEVWGLASIDRHKEPSWRDLRWPK